MHWSRVTCGFNNDEETANFGTRACAVSDEAVYETNTIASIEADQKTQTLPTTSAASYLQNLCVAVDSSLIIFKDEFSAYSPAINLESNIESFCVTPCGSLAIVGAAGNLKCFRSTASGHEEIFSKQVSSSGKDRVITVDLYYQNEDIAFIIVVLSGGKILKSREIDVTKLKEAEDSEVEQLTSDILFESIADLKVQVFSGTLVRSRAIVIVATHHSVTSVEIGNSSYSSVNLLEDINIKKIEAIPNGSTLLALCDNGYLVCICLHTLVPYSVHTDLAVEDFVVFGESTMNECFGNVLILVNNNSSHIGRTLMFTSYPDFNVEYRIEVGEFCYLPKQVGMEEVMFIEGFGDDVNQIDTLRIKSIFQSQPEQRLERMLRRFRFVEAEKFAKSFNLDLDIVYKAHVQRLDQISGPWTNDVEEIKASFNKILELIQKIKDDHFVADVCTTVLPPDFYSLRTMLTYAMERFSDVSGKVDGSLSELLAKVSNFSRRLDTCMLIYGSEATVTHWAKFPNSDLITDCINHIQRNEMKEANLIWGRHCHDLQQMLSVQKARQILNTIPKSVEIPDVIQWLDHFVPSTLSHFEDFVSDVAQWTIQRVRHLEITNNQKWLDSGTLLLKRMVQLLHTPLTEKNILVQSMRMSQYNDHLSCNSPVKSLLKEIDTLQEIKNLKQTYSINITYDQFIEEDHKSFVIVLLDNVAIENISSFLNDCFPRLMRERQLEPDSQILQFVQEVVTNCENYVFLDEAPWEGRVAALIPHIQSNEIKLNTILLVLRAAPVPWTATVSDLAQLGSRLPHARANDVRTEIADVPKRMLMKKYGRPLPASRKNELLMVRIILKRSLDCMLEDIQEFVKCLKEDPTDVYVCVLTHLIENNEDDKVWAVLKSLKTGLKTDCVTRLLYQMRIHLSFGDWERLAKYFRFSSEFEKLEDNELYHDLKKVHSMKEEFGIETSIAISKSEKDKILKSHAKEASAGIESGNLTVFGALKRIKRLCYLLNLSLEEGLITLAIVCSNNLEISLDIASEIEDIEGKSLRVYEGISVLIGHLMSTYDPSKCTSNVIDRFNVVTRQLASRFITYSSNYDVGCVTRWISLLHRGSSHRLLKTSYEDPAPTPTTAMFLHSSVYNMIHYYASICKNNEITLDTSTQAMVTLSPHVKVETGDMMAIWKKLKEEQQNLACIRLIFEFCWAQHVLNLDSEDKRISDVLPQFIKDLLKKLFRLPKFDVELSLALLHFFEKKEAIRFLIDETKSVGFNLQRLSAISQLGLAFCYLNKIQKYLEEFKKHHIACKWAKKLLEYGLQYKDAFKSTKKEHQHLVTKLITLPSANTTMLKEFCNDYEFDLQECMMMFLEHLVMNWEPDFHVTQDASGNTVMTVRNDSCELLRQCEAILDEIAQPTRTLKWPQSVQNTIVQLWNKVNFYYYEVHNVICSLMSKIISPHTQEIEKINSYKRVLQFFKMYTRISPPEKSEQEQWFNSFPNTNNLPIISNYRLPFTRFFSKDQWNLIKPELSLKTYKIWYSFVAQLGLERDMVCVLTIQRLTSDQLAGGSRGDKSSWRLQRCNVAVLREIQECVAQIENPEMAGASLYYVVNHMPPGADQVEAAALCYRQAELWLSKEGETARNAFAKVQKKYLTVSTSHILHKSGLGRPEYLHLVLQPQELICALYDDPSILDPLAHHPDINGAATDVAQLHGVNVMGIRQELLNEWLSYADTLPFDTSADDVTVNIAAICGPLQLPDNDTILRACYVLRSLEEETAALYLASVAGLAGDSEGFGGSMTLRLRALQCLCYVAPPDVIMQATNKRVTDIKKVIQTLMFVSELERLGMIWSPSGFEACNKEDVMRGLISKGSPNAVQLAAALGSVYRIATVTLWDSMLKLLTSYSMVKELTLLLPEITKLSHLLDKPIFIKAWNCAVINPFLKAERPMSEQDRGGVERALQLLYSCPVPSQLDLTTVITHCDRLRCPEIAAAVRPFLLLTAPDSPAPPPLKTE